MIYVIILRTYNLGYTNHFLVDPLHLICTIYNNKKTDLKKRKNFILFLLDCNNNNTGSCCCVHYSDI